MQGTTYLLVLVVALIVIAAGCGGGSHLLSHNEFIKQANAICANYNKRTAALGYVSTRAAAFSPTTMAAALGSPSTLANLISWSEKALPIAKQDVGKFKQLKPSKADEAAWKAYAAEGDRAIVWLGKLHDEAKRSDRPAILRLAAYGQKEAERETRIAQNAGLAECG